MAASLIEHSLVEWILELLAQCSSQHLARRGFRNRIDEPHCIGQPEFSEKISEPLNNRPAVQQPAISLLANPFVSERTARPTHTDTFDNTPSR